MIFNNAPNEKPVMAIDHTGLDNEEKAGQLPRVRRAQWWRIVAEGCLSSTLNESFMKMMRETLDLNLRMQ